jgi:hypothetical protein
MEVYKCQPTIDKPCLTTNEIVSGGGEIMHQLDGSVSVWINTDSGVVPYTNVNTKTCCEYLGYIFDVENQKCLWDDSIACDTCEMKIVINPNGNDGDYFLVGNNSDCSLDINLDYIFKFDCSILASGETINEAAITIQSEIDDLNHQIEDNQVECASLSGACAEYTNIYTGMCYTISIANHVANSNSTQFYKSTINGGGLPIIVDSALLDLPSPSPTVCCLTDEGLLVWQSILGDIKYNAWLASNGCDTTIYTTKQAQDIYTQGNTIALENNTLNPYFSETTDGICDKQIAYEQMLIVCGEYQECLDLIADLESQVIVLEAELAVLETEGALCDDPIANLENFTASFSLDVETETPMLYETVYEESIFGIGEGNLMQYIIDTGSLSGIMISGDTGVLPGFSVDATCDYDEICKAKRDEFIRQLYITQYLPNFGAPENNLENTELLQLMGGWYNSDWLNYGITINDPLVIEKIKNKKIRISIKVNTCCLDFGILLDKIKITQNCDVIENTLIKITKPFGFELDKFVDNKKSWVSNEIPEKRFYQLDWRNTEYTINDYRLSINTKEIDLNIDPAKAIEGDVFKYLNSNPCALDCTTGTTILHMSTDIDLQSILDAQIADCCNPIFCANQKQFQDYDCFDLMNGEPYEFQYQNSPIISGDCVCSVTWGITAKLEDIEVYNDDNFYSGTTTTSIPTQTELINQLNYIANTIGVIFIINGNTVSFIDNYTCDDIGFKGQNLNIDLNISLGLCGGI